MTRRILWHNWRPKLMCLLLAVVLWLTVSGRGELSESVSVPVQYRNLQRHLEISSDLVEQVHLILRGSSTRLSRLSPGSIPVVVDLSETRVPGERTFTIGESNLRLPAGVSLERVVPGQIRLRLEARITRQVPVRVRFTGDRSIPVQVQPAELTIAGPESRVARINEVQTDALSRELLEGGEQLVASVYSGDPQVHFVGRPAVLVRAISQ